MNRRIAWMFIASSMISTMAVHGALSHQDHQHGVADFSALAKVKQLVGTWVALDENGEVTEEVVSVFRETAGGSAVFEVFYPGQPQEMINTYVQEGDDLIMTHFCMLGNQPRLRAGNSPNGEQVIFEFAGHRTIDPQSECHMHKCTIRFLDENTIKTEWIEWDDGKPTDRVQFHLRRIVLDSKRGVD